MTAESVDRVTLSLLERQKCCDALKKETK